jgi:NADPH:quinone reductase-like Zn-dependent oxidoreductase
MTDMKVFEIAPGATSLDGLKRGERAEPKPRPGEVKLRIRAASLNARDHGVVRGIYRGGPVARPTVPLSDGAGEVVEVGSGVRRVAVGDKVCAIFCQRWVDGAFANDMFASTLGSPLDGMLAEYGVFSEEGVVKFPAHLSYEEAATLPCAAVTAWNALIARGRLEPGQWVLALGTGGVSVFALQFAKAAGARCTITSSSDDKLARARSLGADHTINYKATPEWEKEVMKITGGRGADHVIEVGGAGTLGKSVAALTTGGQIHQIGFLAGRETPFDLSAFVGKRAILNGTFVGSRAMFEHMNAAIEANRISPVVDKVFPFEDARAAYEYQRSSGLFGKVVISV